MRLPASGRLALWEAAADMSPAERDLALLEAGFPGVDPTALRALSVGRCDAWLLELYEATFGPRLDAVFDCASCGQAVEVAVDVTRLRAGVAPPSPDEAGEWVDLVVDGYDVRFRLPDAADLAAVAALGSADRGEARLALAGRVLRAWRDGVPVAVGSLPPPVLDAAGQAMADRDPMADLALSTSCPWCGVDAAARLDIGGVLWTRIAADARRLLSDVDVLARAYGWAEAEILALAESRRRAYLELAR